jgi:hypothetical protein
MIFPLKSNQIIINPIIIIKGNSPKKVFSEKGNGTVRVALKGENGDFEVCV